MPPLRAAIVSDLKTPRTNDKTPTIADRGQAAPSPASDRTRKTTLPTTPSPRLPPRPPSQKAMPPQSGRPTRSASSTTPPSWPSCSRGTPASRPSSRAYTRRPCRRGRRSPAVAASLGTCNRHQGTRARSPGGRTTRVCATARRRSAKRGQTRARRATR